VQEDDIYIQISTFEFMIPVILRLEIKSKAKAFNKNQYDIRCCISSISCL